MDEQTQRRLDDMAAEISYLAKRIFQRRIDITIEDSEDAPCIVLDNGLMICYCHHEDYEERVYVIQAQTVEHNYPSEPDWIDYIDLDVTPNRYKAVDLVLNHWLQEEISIIQENRYWEQQYEEHKREEEEWLNS